MEKQERHHTRVEHHLDFFFFFFLRIYLDVIKNHTGNQQLQGKKILEEQTPSKQLKGKKT